MLFLCIMGGSGSGKSTLEKELTKFGYKKSVSYTTRKPKVRDGYAEKNGEDYYFVTREKFMELVQSGIIIEYEEYNGNLYGTPEPFGSTRYVAVVCTNGYKALKERYGKQVVGIYVDTPDSVAYSRAVSRDNSSVDVESRANEDRLRKEEMKQLADFTVNNTQSVKDTIVDIIKFLKARSGE